MKTSRRNFLQAGLGGTALVSLSGAVPQFLLGASSSAAKVRSDKVLVVVELSGGNDGLNTVIPYDNDAYYENRFTLAIDKNSVLKVDDHIGLHPAMQGFAGLLEENQLAIIQGVGYPNPNRSHFESMDLWHSAHQVGDKQTGWVGRCVEQYQLAEQLPAIHFGSGQQPLAVKSLVAPSPSIRTLDDFQLQAARDKQLGKLIKSMVQTDRNEENPLLTYVHENAKIALDTSQRLARVDRSSTGDSDYPATELGRNLQSIARLIDSGLPTRIYYVTLGGFDTHSNQLESHQGLLRELSDSVSAFMKDVDQQGNGERVAVMSFSEFGRRVRENASRGTDHGTAAPMFVIGNNVNSGLIGEHPSFDDLVDGDFKHGVDYRSVYGSVLENWLGVEARPILGGEFESMDIFAG